MNIAAKFKKKKTITAEKIIELEKRGTELN